MQVVADAGPLHYLVLIEAIDLLPDLFGRVLVPRAVQSELSSPGTPLLIRSWLDSAPGWLVVSEAPLDPRTWPPTLGAGEREAIALATARGATLLLIDDRAAVAFARSQGFVVVGTLGVLIGAAQRGLVDLQLAISRLRATNFRYRPAMLDELIATDSARAKRGPHPT